MDVNFHQVLLSSFQKNKVVSTLKDNRWKEWQWIGKGGFRVYLRSWCSIIEREHSGM